jgi:hypothetical protein
MFEKIDKTATVPGLVLRRANGTKRPAIIFLHGNGERGDGKASGGLETLLTIGIPEPLKEAVEARDYWLLAPQMASNWSNTDTTNMFVYATGNALDIDYTRILYIGLSSGGGAMLRWLSALLSNAQKITAAVIICPAYGGITLWKNITDAKVACWFHHNLLDDLVPVSNTDTAVTEINKYPAPVPAVKTVYPQAGHGAWLEATGLTPPKAPGGKGITNALVNIYDWFDMMTQGFPVLVPNTTALKAVAGPEQIVTAPFVKLDGTGSENYVKDKSNWKCKAVPDGVNKYAVNASAWITAEVTLPQGKYGVYDFELTVQDAAGNVDWDIVSITYASVSEPPPPAPIPKSMKNVFFDTASNAVTIQFSDNSRILVESDGTVTNL